MLKTCQSLSSKIFEKHSPTFWGSYSVPFWEWASSRGHLSPKPETQGRKVSPLQGQRTHAKRNGAGTGHPRGARLRHRRCPRPPRVGRFCREKQDDALCLGSPLARGAHEPASTLARLSRFKWGSLPWPPEASKPTAWRSLQGLRSGAHDVKEDTKNIKEEDSASRGLCLREAAIFLAKEKLSKTTSGPGQCTRLRISISPTRDLHHLDVPI